MSEFLSKRLADLAPYVPGEQPQGRDFIKLNTNESPFAPSKGVLDIINGDNAALLRLYPDPTCEGLAAALSESLGVSPENLAFGNGSDEILSFFFMAFCDNETPVAFPDISYGFYSVFAQLYGLDYEEIPLAEDFQIDYKDYVGINKNIVIANPNAPTGIFMPLCEIEEILKSNPKNLVVIDEAYVDFGGRSAITLIDKYKNLLVVQTYSKSRSMAGARLGFAVADRAIIDDLNKIRFSTNPYNINRLTLAAGAAAAHEAEYYRARCKEIEENREYLTRSLLFRGFTVLPSKANFVFARHKTRGGEELYKKLRDEGILVRHFNKARIRDFLRITVGTRAQCEALVSAVDKIK